MIFKIIARSLIVVGSAIAVNLVTTTSAWGIGFTGLFDVSNFTFSSSPTGAVNPATDLVTTDAATGTIILYSPDNSTNGLVSQSANTYWTINITPATAGTISFNWSYENFDLNTGDDTAGYVLNGVYYDVGSGASGSSTSPVNLTVSAGDVFGFQAYSNSNSGGSGAFTVSNFQASPVPWEFSPTTGMLALCGGVWGGHQSRKFFTVIKQKKSSK